MYNYYEINPLHISLPKTCAYVKSYDGQIKWMYFLIEDDNLLKRCHAVWDRVSPDIKKGFDSKPDYSKCFLKRQYKISW